MKRIYKDKEIICVKGYDHTFIWLASEQEYFEKMKFNTPKRCGKHAYERRKYFNERK